MRENPLPSVMIIDWVLIYIGLFVKVINIEEG